MTTIDSPTPGARRHAGRMTPARVRRWEFARTPLGRRGYLESDVDRFRQALADEIAAGDAEKAELRAEVDRLRNYFRERRIDPANGSRGSSAAGGSNGLSAQAVNMMSMAQQAADQHIAQAETYARELVGDARRQHEEILLTAHRQAEEAARQAAVAYEEATAVHDRTAENAELQSRIAYLRTFADVTQVQVTSILQALGHELDRLTRGNRGTHASTNPATHLATHSGPPVAPPAARFPAEPLTHPLPFAGPDRQE